MYKISQVSRLARDRYHTVYGALRDGLLNDGVPPDQMPDGLTMQESLAVIVASHLRRLGVGRESQLTAAAWCLHPDLAVRLSEGYRWLIVTSQQCLAVREDAVLRQASDGDGAAVLVRVGQIAERLRQEAVSGN